MQYTGMIFLFIYETAAITIHFHFAFLMYNTYKLRPVESDINKLL